MAARILCFGTNDCNRSRLLLEVGYEVVRCLSVDEFHAHVRQRPHVDVVLVTEGPTPDRRKVVALTREYLNTCLVLCDDSYTHAGEKEFDLIFPPLTTPRKWLHGIADLIERCHALGSCSAMRTRSRLVLIKS